MSYVKHTWTTGEVVTAENLNHVETGIENSQEKIDAQNKLSADHLAEGSTNKLVSATEKETWSGKSVVSVSNTGTATDEVTYITVDGVEKKLASASGEGKAWKEITLSGQDVLTLASGKQIVRAIDPLDPTKVYDPTNFKNDYFTVKVEQSGVNYGNIIYPGDNFTSLKVSIETLPNVVTYLTNSLVDGIQSYGFDHNYYKTLVLFTGTDDENMIKSGTNVVESQNTIYVQDVSQQKWEYNTYWDEFGGKEVGQAREQSDVEIFGRALVFSFKGATSASNKGFLYCLQDSQAAFWYETSEGIATTRWANITAGKAYPVYFDTTHDTLRWLLSNVVPSTTFEGEYDAVEMTNAEKGSYMDGFTFGANLKSAAAFEELSDKTGNKVIGCEYNWLERVFSFNQGFGESETTHLEYIGRPNGYMLNTISYDKGGEIAIEKDGEHVWTCDVEGITVNLIIPDNIYEDGSEGLIPHRDTYIMQFDMSSATTNNRLYRHTFTVTPSEYAEFESGETIARVTFCAVNAQAGDSSSDYLLHSDETGQEADWILPASGVVGIATGSGQAVTTWYPALRVVAGWKEVEGNDSVRCIYVNYFDTSTSTMQKVEFIRDDNAYKFDVRDFRTDILTVKSPYGNYKY